MTQRKVKIELGVPIPAEAVKEIALDMAKHQSALIRMRGEYKDIQREWREKIKHKEGVVQELCERVTQEERLEFVDCVEEYDWDHHKIRVRRLDTNETVGIREASEAERESFEELDGDQRQTGLELAADADEDSSAEASAPS
jgi:hypothetical protein